MKPSPQYDFPISVRNQIWEEEAEVAPLYDGIFEVQLNFTISVMFIPAFEIPDRDWVQQVPEDVDKISTELEARLITIAFSKYSVIPNDAQAGTESLFQRSTLGIPEPGLIFYVTSEAFATFSLELSDFAEALPAVHSSRRVSEVADLEFVQFLVSRIVESKHFSPVDLPILGRGS
ncbi:MAG: hypothetical protein KME18_23155 [Phormidium tanganyikae FI6-MK23]|jgi:hypothetical protein|nr:hypothetical protein [Phormidium tanganyikae FI6-MK23]